jgi:hypothetical protein
MKNKIKITNLLTKKKHNKIYEERILTTLLRKGLIAMPK